MPILTAALSGVLFGLGLLISGLANPAKVLAFLDLAGAWDPSLALVMGGAIGVGFFAFSAARQRRGSPLNIAMQLPDNQAIDRRLIIGSLMFGIGWGIAGLCPGPVLVALGLGQTKAVVFFVAMLAGMAAFELLESRKATREPSLV